SHTYCSYQLTDGGEAYPLPLHDALPILGGSFTVTILVSSVASLSAPLFGSIRANIRKLTKNTKISAAIPSARMVTPGFCFRNWRSEEHTSELQSREKLVCRLLREQKKTR